MTTDSDDPRKPPAPAIPPVSWGYIAMIVLGVIAAVAIICAIATLGGRQKYSKFACTGCVVSSRA